MAEFHMSIAKFLNADASADLSWLTMAADGPNNNLFVNDWPDAPDNAARLIPYAGRAPSRVFGNPLQVRHPRLQITLRGSVASNVILERADAIIKKLAPVRDTVLFGVNFQSIESVGEPFEIGPDSSDRERVVVNFEIGYYDSV